MTPVILSNPGLPLAVYGNPPRNKKWRKYVQKSLFRKNPPFEYSVTHDDGSVTKDTGIFDSASSARRSLKHVIHGKLGRIRSKSKKTAVAAFEEATQITKGSPMKHRRRRSTKGRIGHTYGRARKGWVKILHRRRRAHAMRPLSHPAIPWSGIKGSTFFSGVGRRPKQKGRGMRRIRFTNPKSRKSRRARRNPGALSAYVGGITKAPTAIFSTVKSMDIKSIGFLAGGSVVSYLAAGLVSAKLVQPLLDKVLPATLSPGTRALIARGVGAALPYTAAFLVSKFVLKGSKYSTPLLLGGALASFVELIKPGMVGDLLTKVGLSKAVPASLKGLADDALAGPTNALCGYVEAPGYSGVGAYVEAPGYSGVGEDASICGYVEAPSYSGVGEVEGYLDQNYLSPNYIAAK